MSTIQPVLTPGRIGGLEIPNRLIRAATSETMAAEDGSVTDQLIGLYSDLARGGAGLIITGHMWVSPEGRYTPRQTGIDSDAKLAGLRALVQEVHRQGGRIFCEIAHAGSQSVVPGNTPVAPSVVPNAIFQTTPRALEGAEVATLAETFGQAAARAKAAGFDGVHIHGGNGYLISQFLSPRTNLRDDDWGGSAERRGRFLAAVHAAVRREVGPDFPVTARIGMADVEPGGLQVEDTLATIRTLLPAGLDGLEPVFAVMNGYRDNIRPYVGVGARRAVRDWAFERLWMPAAPEAYYRHFARSLKAALPQMPVILVGGIRSPAKMNEVLSSGDADFLAAARPFIREPDLPRRIANGRNGPAACVSCNLCLMHEGEQSLRCWRKTTGRLLHHLWLKHVARR